MYAKTKEEFGLEAPRRLGVSKPGAVASGVIRAIKKDLPEVIVNPRPIRPLLMINAVSPSLGEWIVERTGANAAFFRKAAEVRESQRAEAKQEVSGGAGRES